MSEPHYGEYTLIRPLRVRDLATDLTHWTRAQCPYCGRDCWKHELEPDVLPPGFTAACTDCAVLRRTQQREMDRERYRRELQRN